jgi:flagellar motor switch protein FliN/FliY
MAPSSALGTTTKPGLATPILHAERDSETTVHAPSSNVVAKVADFAELTPAAESPSPAPLDRLLGVSVTATAELGRATLAVGDVLKLGVGSILQLDRPVSEPVDLVIQGVRLARGEVVIVDDRFAIHIKEILSSKKQS